MYSPPPFEGVGDSIGIFVEGFCLSKVVFVHEVVAKLPVDFYTLLVVFREVACF